MKKILFLINSLQIGGAEHVLVNIANHLDEAGYSVTIQTLLDDGPYCTELKPNVQYRRVFPVKTRLGKKILAKLYLIFPERILANILIRKEYSHVVAFAEGIPTKIVGGCSWPKVKKLAWIHTDVYANYILNGTYRSTQAAWEAYQKFDRLICVSEDAKEGFLHKIGPHDSIHVQYNPINKMEVIQRSQCATEYDLKSSNVFRLVALGRLVYVKGFDMLIDAMSLIQERAKRPVELYIVGGGQEEETLKQRAGSNNSIFFCGLQKNPFSIMSQCDLQIVSSRAEGYPLSLCEGHILGLPAVATKCAGPKEILTASGAGVLVDISMEALADGITKMVNDPEIFQYYKKKAEDWSERYSESDVYSQIEALFD